MANIIDDLNYRGLIKDYSNEEEIRELLSTPQTIYCGFDPSASSMHIGNFVMIATLMRLQRAGHRIIAVVGAGGSRDKRRAIDMANFCTENLDYSFFTIEDARYDDPQALLKMMISEVKKKNFSLEKFL